MSIARLHGLLESIEILNHGTDHGCEYAIYQLPEAPSFDEALNLYFASLSTSSKPAQPAEHWHIRTSELGQPWRPLLSSRLKHWFFEEEYSQKVNGWNQQAFVDQVINYLVHEIGEPSVSEVFVSPPMWYDCQWQDFAFTSSKGRWMLHLGFSD
jgi:hypothetical protein